MLNSKELFARRRDRTRFHLRKKAKRSDGTMLKRLSVFRSSKHIYAQLIDDQTGNTLASASTVDKELRDTIAKGTNKEAASAVGALVAKRAIEAGCEVVVFDRGGYKYHGRVQALAEAARANGLKF